MVSVSDSASGSPRFEPYRQRLLSLSKARFFSNDCSSYFKQTDEKKIKIVDWGVNHNKSRQKQCGP